MRVVIDTNIFVMTLTSRSPFHFIYQSLVSQQYTLLLSNEILLEYEEIIAIKYGRRTADFFMQLVDELPNIDFITPFYRWNMISIDKDDNKYTDCMVAGQADFLVTEDRHFNILHQIEFLDLKVIDLEGFATLVRNIKSS